MTVYGDLSEWLCGGTHGHDCNEHVLLSVEAPGVKAPLVAKRPESLGRHDAGEELAARVGNELRDVGTDKDGRQAVGEQGVDERPQTRQEGAENEHAEGEGREGRVVGGVDVGADLEVRRVVGREDGLELHLLEQLVVAVDLGELLGLVLGAGQELLHAVERGAGEVLVVLVDLVQL